MKKILILLSVVLGLLVILIFLAYLNLNTIIKKGITQVGPKVTKTSVKVDKVKVSLFSGQGSLYNFVLGNPKGFDSPYLFKVNQVSLDLKPLSLLDDLIVIEKVYIDSPNLIYELKGKVNNLQTFADNIGGKEETKEGQDKQAAKATEKKEKSILIKEFILKRATVEVILADLGKQRSQVLIDEIRLTNLGGKGKTAKDIANQVAKAILEKVLPGVGPAIKEIKNTVNKVKEKIQENIEDLKKGSLDKQKIEKQAESFKENIESQNLENKLKGLFPGQKK